VSVGAAGESGPGPERRAVAVSGGSDTG